MNKVILFLGVLTAASISLASSGPGCLINTFTRLFEINGTLVGTIETDFEDVSETMVFEKQINLSKNQNTTYQGPKAELLKQALLANPSVDQIVVRYNPASSPPELRVSNANESLTVYNRTEMQWNSVGAIYAFEKDRTNYLIKASAKVSCWR